MPAIFLIGSGAAGSLEYYKAFVDASETVIGIDGGSNHLFSLRCKPDWVTGDNDSIQENVLGWLQTNHIQQTIFPKEKNESDFELATDRIIAEYKPCTVYLAGMLGNRLDHELVNINIGRKLKRVHFQPIFISEYTWVRYIKDAENVTGQGKTGDLLSLISLSDFIWIKQTLGLQYPLKDEKVEKLSSRGLSNVLLSDRFELESSEGEALLVYTGKEKVPCILFR